MRIDADGNIVLPVALRERLGLFPGCEIEVVEEDGRIYLRRIPGKARAATVVQEMAGKGDIEITSDEALDITRGEP